MNKDGKQNPENVTPDPNAAVKGDPQSPNAQEGGQAGNEPDKKVPLQALHEEREKRQSLQAELEALKEQVQGMNQFQQPQQNQYGQPQQQQYDPAIGLQGRGNTQYGQLDELWETDPRKAMQTELMMGFTWYDKVQQKVNSQADVIAQKDPNFNKIRSKVMNYVNRLPIQQRGQDGIVDLAYNAVRGQNMDTLVNEQVQKRQAEIMEKIKRGEQVQGIDTGTSSAPPKQPQEATDEQKKMAANMNMSVEDYLKYAR